LDWCSKRWLLDQIAEDAPWSVRKKVDLRYHELSENGYLLRLRRAAALGDIVEEGDIERARRMPPEGSPAMKRGYLIREFAGDGHGLRVGWDRAEFKIDGRRRRVALIRR
jgi:proteasome accessory factor A